MSFPVKKRAFIAVVLCAVCVSMRCAVAHNTTVQEAQTQADSPPHAVPSGGEFAQNMIHVTLFNAQGPPSQPHPLSDESFAEAIQIYAKLNQCRVQVMRKINATEHTGVEVHLGQVEMSRAGPWHSQANHGEADVPSWGAWQGQYELTLEAHDYAAIVRLMVPLASDMKINELDDSMDPNQQGDAASGERLRQQQTMASEAILNVFPQPERHTMMIQPPKKASKNPCLPNQGPLGPPNC